MIFGAFDFFNEIIFRFLLFEIIFGVRQNLFPVFLAKLHTNWRPNFSATTPGLFFYIFAINLFLFF